MSKRADVLWERAERVNERQKGQKKSKGFTSKQAVSERGREEKARADRMINGQKAR